MLNKRFSSPLAQSVLLLVAIAVSLIGVTLLATLCAPLFGFSFTEVSQGTTTGSLALSRYLLAVQSIGIFLLPPFLAAMLIAPRRANILLGTKRKPLIINLLKSSLMILTAVPFISLASSANALLPLPQWAAAMEASAALLTEELLLVADVKSFVLNIFVMALLPAVCEEVFFRGYIQRVLRDWIKNPHLTIFCTSLFFSAFHLQFAGFIPRFLLGAMLGYLFYWSDSLWLSITAHFTNNVIAVCAYFYAARNSVPLEDEQVGTFIALLSVALTAHFMYSVFVSEKLRRKMKLARKKTGGDFTPIV